MHRIHAWTTLAAALALGACAPDLGETLGDEGTNDDGGHADGGGPQVQHEDEGDGVTLSVIDASDDEVWVYLDLESGDQETVDDPLTSDAWDLGLLRFNIAINGGISGPGGMEAVLLEDVAFADVTEAPTEGWVTDAVDGDDENEDPDYALASWYDYDFMTHVLTPRPQVYGVRTVEGGTFKLEFVNYYDDAGTSGFFTIRWAPLAPE